MTNLESAQTPTVHALELFSLKGKNALITGGSRGIGAAMAHALADAGASVCIAQRDVGNTTTADAIRSKGTKVEVVSCDLTNIEDVKSVFQKALDVMGGSVDILVNCGGLLKRNEAISVTEEEWDNVIDVNQKALFFLCQSAGRHMIPRRTGKILNVASINSFVGGDILAPYAASKAAVAQLTKALSNEWAKFNIQVNAIAPGYIATDMNTDIRSKPGHDSGIGRCPAGRWGTPADLVGPTVFLCSGASQYITGEILLVDGGYLGQ